MCKTNDYEWSSYKEYIGNSKIIDKEELMKYFNNDLNEFVKFTTSGNINDIDDFSDYEIYGKLKDEQALEIIMEKFALKDVVSTIEFFQSKNNIELKEYIDQIKNIKGITFTQISRIIHIDKGRIKKMWN